MTNQTHFKYKDWWVYSEFGRACYTAWGSKTKTPSLFPPLHNDDTYFQFGTDRKNAIDKLILELNNVSKMA